MISRAIATLAPLVLAGALGGVAHIGQLRVDELREGATTRRRTRVMPNPQTLRAVCLGEPAGLGSILWVRVTLNFVDLTEHPSADGPPWLQAMLRGVLSLEPSWRTPYFYGGSMMRVIDNIDGSDEVFLEGTHAFPDDPYFPFSLGMNAYLYRHDPHEAVRWLTLAAQRPGAPPWYGAASAGFLDEHGQRTAAISYLKEQLAVDNEPAVRDSLLQKYRQVQHDELSSRLTVLKDQWEEQHGQPLTDVAALGEVPPDPLGDHWIIAPDGAIRSGVAERKLALELRDTERAMLMTGR